MKSWRRRAEFAKFNNLLKKFIYHHQAKFAAFALKRLLPPPRCACKMREECKKQFALWVMLEIKKYLRGWAGLAFQYVSIKWRTFVNDFSLSFVSLPCCLSISAEVSLSFKWIVLCLLAKLRLQTFHPSLCLSIYSSDLPFTLSAIICMWDVDIFFLFLFIQWHFNLFFFLSLALFQPFMSTSSNARIRYFPDICNLTWVMHDSHHVIETKNYHHVMILVCKFPTVQLI